MNYRQGFTLIELLMAILLVSVLATIAVAVFVDFGRDARIAITKDRMNLIKLAILGDSRLVAGGKYTKPGFLSHCGVPPLTLSELTTAMPGSGICASAYNPLTQQGWKAPYLSTSDSETFKDAWGESFDYNSVGRTITSHGPDQSPGTSDDIVISF
ncbi:MAG: type II secretion system GspH family protein [Bdellovibrionales bacterium]|nr:type II secretion system GspH family protein [Bdellovibrionales bacterium]